MKRKLVALLLSGLMAVGGLSLHMPAAVQAEEADEQGCEWTTREHITDYAVTKDSDGQLTLTVSLTGLSPEDTVKGTNAGFIQLYPLEKYVGDEMDGTDEMDYFLAVLDEWMINEDHLYPYSLQIEQDGTYVLPDLKGDKTYYVYAMAYEWHGLMPGEDSGEHLPLYLGSGTPTKDSGNTSGDNPPADDTPADDKPADNPPADNPPAVSGNKTKTDPYKIFEDNLTSQIRGAQSGSTIVLDQGVPSLSNAVMKELLKKQDVSLKLVFTYNDKDYVILIPAGAALDNDIPWYGPLYLAEHFGNSAGTENTTSAGGTYVVQSGDTLSKIAAANNMTLKQLLKKNPQIKDADKIVTGQKLDL